jgi:Mg/Co/Ni transporter MgtE
VDRSQREAVAMTLNLPRQQDASRLSDQGTHAEKFARFADDVIDFLRLMPTMEIRTIRTDGGDYPLYVLTETRRPLGVIVLRSFLTADPAQYVSYREIDWSPSNDVNAPGIVVYETGAAPGPSPGDEVDIVVLILGERD